MNKQKHRRAWELGRALPSLNFCAITTTGRGGWAESLVLTKEKQKKKMQIWNSCVCRRQSDEQRSEVLPLKRKLWQAPVHPWHGLLLIYCASVLCVGWKASSFLWLAASFLSHIFFSSSSVPSSPAQPPKEVFGQSARKNSFWKWTFFFWCEHRCVQRWKCLTSLPYFLRNTKKSAQRGYRARRWGQSGNEGVGFFGQRGDVGFRRNRGDSCLFTSRPHLA